MIKKTPKPEAFENNHKPDRSSLLNKYSHYNKTYRSFLKNSQAQNSKDVKSESTQKNDD